MSTASPVASSRRANSRKRWANRVRASRRRPFASNQRHSAPTLAAQAAQVNRSRRRPIRFAFNVSVLEFTRRDMVAFVRQVLEETGCRAEWLTLEFTENLMVGEPDNIRRAFGDLRRLGVDISIDDFGTGYSNLRYLESFPLSEIKVDRSFVHDVAHSAAKRVIVESVIKLGAALDIRVVAEGIETDAERAIMRALGCSIGQGFFSPGPWTRPDCTGCSTRSRSSARGGMHGGS